MQVLLAAVATLVGTAAVGTPRGRQLLIAATAGSTHGVVTTFGTVTKHPSNPLLKIGAQQAEDKDAARPWSSGSIYSAVIADQTGRRRGKPWRCYFTAGLNWTMVCTRRTHARTHARTTLLLGGFVHLALSIHTTRD